MDKIVLAASTSPQYFNPTTIPFMNSTQNFYAGSSIAQSPAMYSYFLASEFWDIDPKKIAMVSIGTKSYSNNKINGDKAGVLDWITRFTDLLGPVKKFT